jgi:hypothetical protein
MTLLVLHFITRSSWPNSIIGSKWKRTFSSSKVKDGIPHMGKNFQTEAIIGVMEDDILLDRLNRMGTRSRVRSGQPGSTVDRHHVGYLLKINDTRAPIGQMVDVCEATTI